MAALEQAYTSYIASERFPCCVLFLDIDPTLVDVNVHPAKLEVKFSNEKPVFEAIYYAVRNALEENKTDLIVLAGFMCILSAEFTKKYENRIINVHPSLIPSFCGKGFYGLKVHEAALSYGVKVTGATVHFVNGEVDGGKIILQKAVYVQDGDTPEVLQARVMKEAEHIILPEAIKKLSMEK